MASGTLLSVRGWGAQGHRSAAVRQKAGPRDFSDHGVTGGRGTGGGLELELANKNGNGKNWHNNTDYH